jgi:hypothetical protein
MNAIARIEHVCARFVEDAFARVFPSALDPIQVGRKLVAVMQATPSDTYLVLVHPLDYARFEADRDLLEAQWTAMLRDDLPAGRREQPRAILHEDPQVVAGSVLIKAVLDERPQPLAFVRGDGRLVVLADGMRIGRSADNELVVADARVSRHHATIVAEGTTYSIVDAGSSNGTFVDGVVAARSPLRAGSAVTLGDTVLRVVAHDG